MFQKAIDDLIASWGLLQGLPRPLVYGALMLGAALAVTVFISLVAMLLIYLERRIAGRIQSRIGPNRVGPAGLLQPIADGLKLLAKEDIIPVGADRTIFRLAPLVVFVGAFVAFVTLPFGEKLIVADLNIGVFFIVAVLSVEVVGLIMAGWASNNKWSLYGAMREVAQVVSYEVPLSIATLSAVIFADSLSLMALSDSQAGGLFSWNLFRGFPANVVNFLIFFTASLAATKRAPFDLPEAESELVAGYHTEYSGMRFSIFFLAEYAAMYLLCAVAAILFLGGLSSGIPALDAVTPGGLWLFAKAMFLLLLMIWLRWTLPRFRIDQVMFLCYKVLLPFSIGALLWASVWALAFRK